MILDDKDAKAVGRVIREWLAGQGDYLADECRSFDRGAVPMESLADTLDTTARAVRVLVAIEEKAAAHDH